MPDMSDQRRCWPDVEYEAAMARNFYRDEARRLGRPPDEAQRIGWMVYDQTTAGMAAYIG